MYEMTFTPRISEIDNNEKVKITALLDYLQHIAYIHADQLGVGHHQIFHKGLTWLLLRYTIKIIRYPQFNEKFPSSRTRTSRISPSPSEAQSPGRKPTACRETSSPRRPEAHRPRSWPGRGSSFRRRAAGKSHR